MRPHNPYRRSPALLLMVGLLCLAMAGCARQRPIRAEAPLAEAPENLEQLRELNLASFDIVWTTIHERHYDPELGGVDWQAAREEYRPLVADATSVGEARTHMQAMIDLLGQSHMSIIPSSAYHALSGGAADAAAEAPEDAADGGEAPGDAAEGDDGRAGMRVRLVDVENRTVLVTEVDPGSGAEEAGVRPGWKLVRIGALDVDRVASQLANSMAQRGRGKPETYVSFALERRLTGPVGRKISVSFLDESDEEQELEIELKAAPGQIARLGALPPMRVDFESRRIELEGVTLGYIGFDAFLDPTRLMGRFNEAIVDFARPEAPVDAVVIDVRGNVGGIVMMVPGMAGFFIEEPGVHLGTLRMRDSELRLAVNPRMDTYSGMVAVLTDWCSVSAAELLAGGLQAVGRARVFGTPTAGEALPAMITRLPNGDGFLFVFADYATASDQRLEGGGVLPDELVEYDRQTLLADRDPMLLAAARWVREHKNSPSPAE